MQNYRSFKALWLSFFSKDLYRDVMLRWQGFGFTHLLLLNMIIITPAIIYITYDINAMLFEDGEPSTLVTGFVDEVSAQIPPMIFKGGKMTTEVEQPYFIHAHIEEENFTMAMIDVDATLTDLRQSTAIMLLTEDAVHIRKENDQIETRYWVDMLEKTQEETFAIDSEIAHQISYEGIDWFTKNKLWIYISMSIAGWCGTLLIMFLYRVLQSLILGGAVILFAGMMKLQLSYQEAVRLTCVAITPPILIDVSLALLLGDGISLPLFLLLTLGYCFLSVHSNKELVK